MKTEQTTATHPQPSQRRDQEIDRRYGAIGISAVAAAVRCQNLDKKAARPRDREEHPGHAA